jgi:flagellar M-ring protein FliF
VPLALPGGPAGAAIAAAVAGAEATPIKLTMPRAEDNLTLQMLEVAQASGDIQQKSVERIGDLVDRNPTETVSLIRTWLNEPTT